MSFKLNERFVVVVHDDDIYFETETTFNSLQCTVYFPFDDDSLIIYGILIS